MPKAFVELNLKAFDKGYEYGLKALSGPVEVEEPAVEVGTLEG